MLQTLLTTNTTPEIRVIRKMIEVAGGKCACSFDDKSWPSCYAKINNTGKSAITEDNHKQNDNIAMGLALPSHFLLILLGQSGFVRALAPSSPDKWDCISAASTRQCVQQARYATSCPRSSVHMGGGTCHNLFNEVSTVASRTPLSSQFAGNGWQESLLASSPRSLFSRRCCAFSRPVKGTRVV